MMASEHEEKMNMILETPEKDLTAKDILQSMIKLVIGLVAALVTIVGVFIGYVVYKDYQHQKTVRELTTQYSEFINSFEFESADITATQDGTGINIVGGGDVTNGANGNNP